MHGSEDPPLHGTGHRCGGVGSRGGGVDVCFGGGREGGQEYFDFGWGAVQLHEFVLCGGEFYFGECGFLPVGFGAVYAWGFCGFGGTAWDCLAREATLCGGGGGAVVLRWVG